ncbi:glycosyltransferase family 2 protein [Actinomycetospora callitridis]|uniref:glycosyltransferase family 2 protein n=1 Tax=Actinomycetospora callitridis TaxID=913944 RepID=UPI002365E9AE|nr:glycosyltransferase family 2 protein [Actinomycetospora callitridis]MDD7917702.1 glycosyltransferase family 2 protein [Actinomycetospora callitridis]
MNRSVSVVICAYTDERWDDVLAAVSSVAEHQTVAPHEVIVVVDHNPALRDRLTGALPDVLVVENSQTRGLSGGKNTGVAASTGEVVAFLDDDAVAGADWVRTFAEGYDDPDVLGVGGLTLPRWATARPDWFPEEFDWVVGCSFVGREVGAVRNLLGGNASFRREAFGIAGGFPTHIGRTSARSRPLGCEETEFCIRIASHRPGARFVYDPQAVIWHRVPPVREGFRYFRARCYAEGLSKAMVARSVGAAAGLAAERSYAAVTLRRGVVRGVIQAWRGDRAGLRRAGAITAGLLTTTAGYAVGSWQRSA